jgi:hypothetical protein
VRWRREEPAIDWRTAQDALAFLIKIDAKLDEILELLKEEDGEEEGTDT